MKSKPTQVTHCGACGCTTIILHGVEADAACKPSLHRSAPELLKRAKVVVDWFRTGDGWRENTPARVFFLLSEIEKAEGRP